MLSVFIPTTPNPTSGWYAIVPEEEVITLTISIEDAFKVLISGGIVSPMSKPLANSSSNGDQTIIADNLSYPVNLASLTDDVEREVDSQIHQSPK
jgi:uncharacterized membrane protein